MAFFKGIFWRFSGIFCPWTSYRSHILTQEHNILKILSLGLYLDTFSIVFQNFDFWPFYSLFYVIFLAFFGYFLSMNELQITHFDPGIILFENMVFRTASRNILYNFWPYLGGVYEDRKWEKARSKSNQMGVFWRILKTRRSCFPAPYSLMDFQM